MKDKKKKKIHIPNGHLNKEDYWGKSLQKEYEMGRRGKKMLIRDRKLNGMCPKNRSDHDVECTIECTARVQMINR